MAAGATILVKRSAGAPSGGQLAAGELCLDVSNGKLYGSVDGSTVFLVADGISDLSEDATPTLGGTLDADSNKIINLGTPTSGTDAATKTYVDAAINGLAWEQPVIDIQTDNTLDPGATPTTGDRYILSDSGNLHANFGTITGVGDNDIVQYDGADFVVDTDVSVTGEGIAAYNKAANGTYVYNGTAWVQSGGTSDHGGLTGLSDDDHPQYTLISSGAGAPSASATRVGQLYVDTTADRPYISVATGGGSADWSLCISASSTDTLTNKTISAASNTIDGGTI